MGDTNSCEEDESTSHRAKKIHINYDGDPDMGYLLDYENDFTQTQPFSQAQEDDFVEPNPEDEYIDEEPNASNTQVWFYTLFNFHFVA